MLHLPLSILENTHNIQQLAPFCRTIGQKPGESMAAVLERWLIKHEKNQRYVTFGISNIRSLLAIKYRVKEIFPVDEQNTIIEKIEEICISLLADPSRVPGIEQSLPLMSKAEQAFIIRQYGLGNIPEMPKKETTYRDLEPIFGVLEDVFGEENYEDYRFSWLAEAFTPDQLRKTRPFFFGVKENEGLSWVVQHIKYFPNEERGKKAVVRASVLLYEEKQQFLYVDRSVFRWVLKIVALAMERFSESHLRSQSLTLFELKGLIKPVSEQLNEEKLAQVIDLMNPQDSWVDIGQLCKLFAQHEAADLQPALKCAQKILPASADKPSFLRVIETLIGHNLKAMESIISDAALYVERLSSASRISLLVTLISLMYQETPPGNDRDDSSSSNAQNFDLLYRLCSASDDPDHSALFSELEKLDRKERYPKLVAYADEFFDDVQVQELLKQMPEKVAMATDIKTLFKHKPPLRNAVQETMEIWKFTDDIDIVIPLFEKIGRSPELLISHKERLIRQFQETKDLKSIQTILDFLLSER